MNRAGDFRSDLELIRDADFESLYWRYRDWVYALAYRFTSNHEDALDVLQETFAYLASRLPRLNLTASMKTFLYPAVRNLSLELLRKRRGGQIDEQTLYAIPAPASPADPRRDLSAAMGNLPAPQREVLLMRYVDDLSLEEIAAALGIPLGTVKSRIYNALQSLRSDPLAWRYFEIPFQ